MKYYFYLLSFIIALLGCNKQTSTVDKAEIKETETFHSEVVLKNTRLHKIQSKYVDQIYQIKVYIPMGYDENKKYPVLYVTDAETNFGGVSYIVQRLIKDKLIPEILIVGIAYDTDYNLFYRLRTRDLTPSVVDGFQLSVSENPDINGKANMFVKFLEKELFPFIKESYSIQENERAIYGHSFGGLFGTYVFLEHQELFNKYILLAPSLWWNNNQLLDNVDTLNLQSIPAKFFMASGKLERRIDKLQNIFIYKLNLKKIDVIDIKSEIYENETHRTVFGIGFTNGLRYVYSDMKPNR